MVGDYVTLTHKPGNRRRLLRGLLELLIERDNQDPWPGALLRDVRVQLFLTSFLILFVELLCIRWIPAHIRFLSYFSNFILFASFLGIGAGILSARGRLLSIGFPTLLVALAALVAFNRSEVQVTSAQVLYYGKHASTGAENYLVLPAVFVAVTLLFIPLGRPLGRLLTKLPPLQAYAIDVMGSLTGIAAFFLMAFFALPPAAWFGVILVAFLPMLPLRRWPLVLLLLGTALIIALAIGRESFWSPYYKITLRPADEGGYIMDVNQIGHQTMIPYQEKEPFYRLPYQLFDTGSFRDVLILGSGGGSDIAVAVANGVDHIDAVEIDPVIAQLGTVYHPDKPFQDSRVTVHIDDGRAFLNNATKRYDLIIFALADSLTLTSGLNTIRLESFLLTQEALTKARDLLTDAGLLVIYNYYQEDWLVRKKAAMVERVFGEPPYVVTYGGWGRAAAILAGPKLASLGGTFKAPYKELTGVSEEPTWVKDLPERGRGILAAGADTPESATDDWPFLYLRNYSFPMLYLGSLVLAALIATIAVGAVTPRHLLRQFDWHFFFLGAAFMLLETKSLVHFGLLFGSTWMVNTLVFFAILSSVLLAILLNARFRMRSTHLLYVALLGVLLVSYLLQSEALLFEPRWLRYIVASAIAFAPVFLANMVFSNSFRDTAAADIAFASNLLGIMVGGMLEYLSLLWGYRALTLLVMALYFASFFARQNVRSLVAFAVGKLRIG